MTHRRLRPADENRAQAASCVTTRRVLLSVTGAGRALLSSSRDAKTRPLARALASDFTREEQDLLDAAAALLVRLAQCL